MAEEELNVSVKRLIKRLELVIKIMINTQIISKYRSVFKGVGLEFEDFRQYAPGDDAERIDWKASARSNQILIKEFKEERNLDVYFLLDVSSTMVFGSTEQLKMEYASEVVASVGYFISKAGDKIGLLMFNDKVVKTIPTGTGDQQFYTIVRALVNPKFYGGGYDLPYAINFLMNATKRRGLLIIVSDFIGLKEGWDKSIRLASTKFDVVGIMVRDPRDETMVSGVGQIVMGDPFSKREQIVNPSAIKEEYDEYVKKEEKDIEGKFMKSNADFIHLTTDKPFVKPIIEFLIRRRERIF